MTVDLFRRVLPPFGCFIEGRYYVNADLFAGLLPFRLDDEILADTLLKHLVYIGSIDIQMF